MKAKTKKAKPGGLTFKDFILHCLCLIDVRVKSSDFFTTFQSGLINLLILRTVYSFKCLAWIGKLYPQTASPDELKLNGDVRNRSLLF